MRSIHKQWEQAFAVVRVDLPLSERRVAEAITVKQIVSTQELADREVERLSRLNSTKRCLYFTTETRMFPLGTSAGPESS